jgi:carbamoyl-phosphate synthase large subunit
LKEFGLPETLSVDERFYIKSPVFPFRKFPGVDPVLSPEMHSTGEVMGIGKTFGEAYAKAMTAAGTELPSNRYGLYQRQRNRQRSGSCACKKIITPRF